MLKSGLAIGLLLLSGAAPSYAQTPCYTAVECAAVRQQWQARQQEQAAANARQQREAAREAEAARQQDIIDQANARAAQEAQNRQAAIDLANAQAAQEARTRQSALDYANAQAAQHAAAMVAQREREDAAAAQLRAEESPDNHCREPKFAGQLIADFNRLSATQDFSMQAVDIEHLVTINYDGIHIGGFGCHGVFVLQNGRRIKGSVLSRLNVAGSPVISFNGD
jgi:hypothetical protein